MSTYRPSKPACSRQPSSKPPPRAPTLSKHPAYPSPRLPKPTSLPPSILSPSFRRHSLPSSPFLSVPLCPPRIRRNSCYCSSCGKPALLRAELAEEELSVIRGEVDEHSDAEEVKEICRHLQQDRLGGGGDGHGIGTTEFDEMDLKMLERLVGEEARQGRAQKELGTILEASGLGESNEVKEKPRKQDFDRLINKLSNAFKQSLKQVGSKNVLRKVKSIKEHLKHENDVYGLADVK